MNIPNLPSGSWGLPRSSAIAPPPDTAQAQPHSNGQSQLNLPSSSSWSVNLPSTTPSYPSHQPSHSHPVPQPSADQATKQEDDSSLSPTSLQAERKKSKRPRQVLSCTMCVRRKTKCDKIQPCTACVKRGDPEGCQIETGDEPPS